MGQFHGWLRSLLRPAVQTSARDEVGNPPQKQQPPQFPAKIGTHEEPTTPAPRWEKGDIVADLYEIKDIHEGGAMGLVYRAHHRSWNMDLAIKSPRSALFRTGNQKAVFIRECETWTKLGLHPNVVNCYYVRTIDDIPRIFAEYVEGGTLADWIDSQHIYAGGPEAARERILDIAIQFAWGLYYAHCRGVIHRDVKTNNVMMGADCTPKVTDFGIAKAVETVGTAGMITAQPQSPRISRGGMTLAYRSPEQAAGSPLSHKTDIWSWAVSLLEMFFGGIAWSDGQAADDILANLQRSVRGPKPAVPVSPDDVQLLKRCLRRDPDRRPETMLEVCRGVLRLYEEASGRQYHRIDVRTSILSDAPLNPTLTAAADTSNRALSLLDIGKPEEAVQLLRNWLAEHPRDPVPWCNEALIRIAQRETSVSRVAEEFAYEIRPTQPNWNEMGVDGDRLRSFMHGHCAAVHESPVVTLHWSNVHSVLSSSKGGAISKTEVGPAGLGQSALIVALEPELTGTWLGGDDLLLVGFESGRLDLRNVETGQVIKSVTIVPEYQPRTPVLYGTSRPVSNAVRGVAWLPEKGTVMVYLQNADMVELTVPALKITSEWHEQRDFNIGASVPRDASFVLVGELRGVLRVYPHGTPEKSRFFHNQHPVTVMNGVNRQEKTELGMAELTAVACSPDGAWIASGSRSGGLLLWRTDRLLIESSSYETPPDSQFLFSGRIGPLAFSSDSSELFFADSDNTVRELNLSKMNCTEITSLHAGISAIAPCPNGRYIGIGTDDGKVILEPTSISLTEHLPYLISKPKSATERIRLQNDIQTLLRQATDAFQQERYVQCVEAATSGLSLGADEKSLRSPFRKLLLQIPTRRQVIKKVELSWVDGSEASSHVGNGRVNPFVNGVALSRDHVLGIATDRGVDWRRASSGEAIGGVEIAQVRSLSYDSESDGWLVGTLFGGVGLLGVGRTQSTTGKLFQVPDSPALNCIAALTKCWRAKAVIGCSNGHLVFWNGGARFQDLNAMPNSVEAVAVSPDGRWIAFAGLDNVIGCVELDQFVAIAALTGHEGSIRTLAFSPTGQLLASAGDEGEIRLWDLTGPPTSRVLQGLGSRLTALNFAPDGEWLCGGDADGNILLRNIATEESITVRTPYGEISAATFDARAGLLLTGHRAGAVCSWEITWDLDLSGQGFAVHSENLRKIGVARSLSCMPR